MNKHLSPLAALLVAAFAMLACSSSFNVVETQPPAPIQVNAQTDEPVDNTSSNLLPYALYYIADGQIFRMEQDGKTVKQRTNEPVNITDYDVSQANGNLAFVTNNQLILMNADGSNRFVIDGGSHPVFSPDGKTLAYSHDGLTMFDFSTGTSTILLEDQPLGGSLPPAIYTPDKFSPDGAKLLLEVGHPPDSPWSAAIYSFTTNSLTPITSDNPSLSCCTMYGGAEWTADGSSLYAVATTPDSSTPFGALWKVDAATGMETTLIPGSAGEGDTLVFYQIFKPHTTAANQLFFFSAKYPEQTDSNRRKLLIPISTKPEDIIGNWSILRGDTFEIMNEALWAPDGSLFIEARAPSQDVYQGGVLMLYFTDMQERAVQLSQSGSTLKWGP